MSVIRRGGDHLLGLIEGTLDLARIEGGKLTLDRKPMRFRDCMGEIAGLSSKVSNASVTLTSSETRFAFRAAATVGGGSAGSVLANRLSARSSNKTYLRVTTTTNAHTIIERTPSTVSRVGTPPP